MPLIIPSNSISGEFEVANSLRFNSGSSDYLNVTQSSGTSDKIGTFSVWLKGTLGGGAKAVFSGHTDSNNRIALYFSDSLRIYGAISGSQSVYLISNNLFRDPSAWYHFVIAWDTTQGTDTNRFKCYVNGSQITSFSTASYPSQNVDVYWSKGTNLTVGARFVSSISSHYDGYMAETVFIDGQQLDPTSFGEFDEDTGIWKPIDVSGLTFGNNGFYLDFENSGSLGADVSGNGNNFTVNNLTSVDQSTDTCTNNFATMNPLDNYYANSTFSEGNLQVVTNTTNETYNTSTIGASSGKWYCEMKHVSSTSSLQRTFYGIADTVTLQSNSHGTGNVYIYRSDGNLFIGASETAGYGSAWDSTGKIIGIAMDLDNNKLYFSVDGTFQNSGDPTSGATGTGAISLTADKTYFFVAGDLTGSGITNQMNFGSPPYSISSGNSDGNGYGNFEYSVPSGYYALNTKNLAEYG